MMRVLLKHLSENNIYINNSLDMPCGNELDSKFLEALNNW